MSEIGELRKRVSRLEGYLKLLEEGADGMAHISVREDEHRWVYVEFWLPWVNECMTYQGKDIYEALQNAKDDKHAIWESKYRSDVQSQIEALERMTERLRDTIKELKK